MHKAVEDQDEVKLGMALTRQRVLQLHYQIIQRLHDQAGLPVLSVSTYDVVETAAGELTAASASRLVERVQHVLGHGFIPLLFGDAVLDHEWGSTIFSGDAIMYHLAMSLADVKGCAFLTDVPGAYTKDPKHFEDATLISHLHRGARDMHETTQNGNKEGKIQDVTGSMQSKCQWAQRIKADAGSIQGVFICHAKDSKEALAALVQNQTEDQIISSGINKWTTIT